MRILGATTTVLCLLVVSSGSVRGGDESLPERAAGDERADSTSPERPTLDGVWGSWLLAQNYDLGERFGLPAGAPRSGDLSDVLLAGGPQRRPRVEETRGQERRPKPEETTGDEGAKKPAEGAEGATAGAPESPTPAIGGRGANPPHFEPMGHRWDIEPPDYEINEDEWWLNPYYRNILKGDYPIYGEDVFLNLTVTDRIINEGRIVPTPTGTTGPGSNKEAFFGDGEQYQFQNFLISEVNLFKGQQAFKPVDWRLKASVVYNTTYLNVREVQVVNINADYGRDRYSDYVALQEALFEYHLGDLSDYFDFASVEAGILPFRSDFRGFVFDDVNLGARILGNFDQNKWEYNVVFFDQLEKDTNSELNRFRDRDQYTVIANVFRQDFPWKGYTSSVNFHYNHDRPTTHFDRNGFLVRPAPIGFAREHEIDSYYLGWVGEGHLGSAELGPFSGRFNVTHAFYQVLGEDDNNPLAARDVHINAQFAALELSYDFDWARIRGFGEYASGDSDPRDGRATGFDAILDQPNFAGGPVSFFNRQAIQLLGTKLTNRLSPLVDLQTSNLEGQQNFVNPGLMLFGGAFDFEIAPTARCMVGASYLRFVAPETLEVYLETEKIDHEIGTEIFFGLQWRPLLTNNIIFNFGFSPLFPGEGLKKIYQSSDILYSAFVDTTFTW